MLHESITYADSRLAEMQGVEKKSSDGRSVRYSLSLRIGSEQGELTYMLTPYGGEREGGDAQLIGPHLDLRFEQESNNVNLNKDTDVAYGYFRAVIDGTLYLLSHRFCGIAYKKQIVTELPALRRGKLHSIQAEPIKLSQTPNP